MRLAAAPDAAQTKVKRAGGTAALLKQPRKQDGGLEPGATCGRRDLDANSRSLVGQKTVSLGMTTKVQNREQDAGLQLGATKATAKARQKLARMRFDYAQNRAGYGSFTVKVMVWLKPGPERTMETV